MRKIPILLVTHNRPFLLEKVLNRIIRFTPWDQFDLWILDNYSTEANKKIIIAYKNKYKFVNVFSQDFNQISVIQNNVIRILKQDLYIKLDDDILVTEDWYKAFLGVYERNHQSISIGSIIIPINGFSWLPFLQIMNLLDDFNSKFPTTPLLQDCINSPAWDNHEVALYLWNITRDLDKTAQLFKLNNKNAVSDLIVDSRYSIGAIIFSHDFWEKMGGWKVEDGFSKRLSVRKKLLTLSKIIATSRGKTKHNRIDEIIDIITRMNKSALGLEEEQVYLTSRNLGLKQFVTTEGIVYHFAFHPTENYLMENIFLEIKW